MNEKKIILVERLFILTEIFSLIFILIFSIADEIFLRQHPCPLCLLQRIGFFGVILGLLMNLQFGFRTGHYTIVILSALFISMVSLRQIALHIIPGSGFYGNAFFGLHFYTWAFIISMIINVVTALLLGVEQQFLRVYQQSKNLKLMVNFFFGTTLILLGINIISSII